MIDGVNNTRNIYIPSPCGTKRATNSLMDFSDEDQAIVSAEAKMLNELDKFNAGEGNDIELAITTVLSKEQVDAAVAVIKTKNETMDSLMQAF